MKALRLLLPVLLLVAVVAAGLFYNRVNELTADNAKLRAELAALQQRHAEELAAERQKAARELETLRADVGEVNRLRGEVTTLRSGTKELEKLRTENTTLRQQNQTLQTTAAQAQVQASMAAAKAALPTGVGAEFPKESWQFAGYETPEAALVSAIWSMQQGNPQAYLDSLSPDEQQRMAERWQGMTPEQIAAKHQGDVSRISGLKIVGIQDLGLGQKLIQVGIGGTDRVDNARMVNVDGQWKFGGFVRP
jgi:DNA repair ATPase RecN